MRRVLAIVIALVAVPTASVASEAGPPKLPVVDEPVYACVTYVLDEICAGVDPIRP